MRLTFSPSLHGLRTARAFDRWALAALALWLLALAAGPALLQALGLGLNAHGHSHLYAHGHPFVDARAFFGIPNAMDVISNLPLLLAGLLGLHRMRGAHWPGTTQRAAQVFFAGMALSALGSAVYHWAPTAASLVLDRMGMAVVFAGALSLAVAERVGQTRARPVLSACLLLGLVSAALPLALCNVAPWAVLQFGGVAFLLWAATRPPALGAVGVRLGLLIGLYALAKVFEMGDAAVFSFTHGLVSGHSLKHLFAALAALPVMLALRQNAAGRS